MGLRHSYGLAVLASELHGAHVRLPPESQGTSMVLALDFREASVELPFGLIAHALMVLTWI